MKKHFILPCFYCSVDSKEIKMILIAIIGSLVLGSIFILIWSIINGVFKRSEDIKFDVFKANQRE